MGVEIILSALSAALAKLSEPMVKDAYDGLKALIQEKFKSNDELKLSLEKFEKKPDVWKPALADSLEDAGAANDSEILKATQKLSQVLEALNAKAGGNIQVGDKNTQINAPDNKGTVIGTQINKAKKDE